MDQIEENFNSMNKLKDYFKNIQKWALKSKSEEERKKNKQKTQYNSHFTSVIYIKSWNLT